MSALAVVIAGYSILYSLAIVVVVAVVAVFAVVDVE